MRKTEDRDTEKEMANGRLFFTQDEIIEFKEAYTKAQDEGLTHFYFNDEKFDMVYAKYCLSYINMMNKMHE
tara:strand:- start:69 stop:281 length:213 start_codon:yes stop_codon:yes gene_type:complete